jgi:hypothetical protein
MYRVIGGVWSPVESKLTDITGKAQFTYLPDTNYKFFLSKTDYQDYVFYLNPILFTTYDITMERTTSVNLTVDFDGVSVIWSPNIFKNDEITPFSFIISSPNGLLIQYGFNLSATGNTNTSTGTNAIGSQLTTNLNVSNASGTDTVRMDYYYLTTLSGRRDFTVYLPIQHLGTGNTTMLTNKDVTYGLTIFERVLFVTFIIIFVTGLTALMGQVIAGFMLAILILGFTAFIGFIPLWLALPSILVGIFFLTWKSGGY